MKKIACLDIKDEEIEKFSNLAPFPDDETEPKWEDITKPNDVQASESK